MSLNNNYIDEDLSKAEFQEHCDINVDESTRLDIEKGGSGDSYTTDDLVKANCNKLDDENTHLSHHEHITLVKNEQDNDLKENEDLVSDKHSDASTENYITHVDSVRKEIERDTKVDINFEIVNEDLNVTGEDIKIDDDKFNDDKKHIRPTEDVCDSGSTTRESVVSDTTATDPDTFIDILGNGLLTKRVINKGLGRETRPTHGDSVTIEYKAWNSKNEMFAEATETFVIGDGDMVQAFDLALCLAEMQEEFELQTDARFAYGALGMLPDVQPNEALKYTIKLLSSEEAPDYTTYNHDARILAADKKRERGNYLYRREEFSYAVNSYSRAIKIIETDPDFKKSYSDPSKADMFELFVKVTNNLAASQLKLDSFDSVIETCNTILNYDQSNVKALFRKGKALSLKGSYDEAIVILKKAFELDTKNKLIANEIQKCQQLKRHDDEKSARFCRRIFGHDSKKESGDGQQSDNGWKKLFYKYSPYVGAVIITGLSIFLATVAISKSKAN